MSGKRSTVKRPKQWDLVTWEPGCVLAFDPSLANTGWALVEFRDSSWRPSLLARGLITTAPEHTELNGIPGSMERGDLIFVAARGIIASFLGHEPAIVHEWPVSQSWATQGHNAEAGFISGTAIRTAARAEGHAPHGIEPGEMKRLVAGNGRASKDDVRDAVLALYDLPGLRTNEHVRDAMGLAVAEMLRAGRWSDAA